MTITNETLAAIVESPASWREIWVEDLVGTNLCIEHKWFIVLATNHACEMARELLRLRQLRENQQLVLSMQGDYVCAELIDYEDGVFTQRKVERRQLSGKSGDFEQDAIADADLTPDQVAMEREFQEGLLFNDNR